MRKLIRTHSARAATAALLLTPLALLPACGSSNPQPQPGLAQAGSDAAPVATIANAGGPDVNVSSRAKIPTQSSVADLVEHLAPMVVNINVVHRTTGHRGRSPFDFFSPEGAPGPRPRQRTGAGTGFMVDSQGYVVTNAHVVRGADEVTVRLRDDRVFKADVVGRDSKADLALLKLRDAKGLPGVTLGDSDALRVGEQVLAVGNPYGLGHTVTMGIVSAKARTIGAGPYDDFIQTDASINPGNSGGPLFNLRGEVVGINTAIRAGADGIGFAIPVNALKDVVSQLKDKGFVERGKLGLAFQPVTTEIADALGLDRPRGALVSKVLPRSAAAKAGIKSGDVITAIGNTPIIRSEELPRNVARHAPGSSITVHVLRRGKKLKLSARLDKLEDESAHQDRRRSPKAKRKASSMLGIELENAQGKGVRVVGFSKPQKGIQPGDLIVEVNGVRVRNVKGFSAALKKVRGDTALFKVKRNNRERFVGVPLSE